MKKFIIKVFSVLFCGLTGSVVNCCAQSSFFYLPSMSDPFLRVNQPLVQEANETTEENEAELYAREVQDIITAYTNALAGNNAEVHSFDVEVLANIFQVAVTLVLLDEQRIIRLNPQAAGLREIFLGYSTSQQQFVAIDDFTEFCSYRTLTREELYEQYTFSMMDLLYPVFFRSLVACLQNAGDYQTLTIDNRTANRQLVIDLTRYQEDETYGEMILSNIQIWFKWLEIDWIMQHEQQSAEALRLWFDEFGLDYLDGSTVAQQGLEVGYQMVARDDESSTRSSGEGELRRRKQFDYTDEE